MVLINLFVFSREFRFIFELRNKVVFFFFFSFQRELNSTSPILSKELGKATGTLLDSLGTLIQQVSKLCLSSPRRQTTMDFSSP